MMNVFLLEHIKQTQSHSQRHNCTVTVLSGGTETPFFCRERLCLFSLPQPCIRINESLCVYFLRLSGGSVWMAFLFMGHDVPLYKGMYKKYRLLFVCFMCVNVVRGAGSAPKSLKLFPL